MAPLHLNFCEIFSFNIFVAGFSCYSINCLFRQLYIVGSCSIDRIRVPRLDLASNRHMRSLIVQLEATRVELESSH